MKRIFYKISTIASILFVTNVNAQNLPNADFESWTTISRDTLVGWKGTLGVEKITGKGGVGSAVKVVTSSQSDIASLVSGTISCITGCSGQIKGTGIPLNGATGAISISGDFGSSAQSPIVAIAFFDINGVILPGGINNYYGGFLPGQPTLTNWTVSTFISSATVPIPSALSVPSGAASMILGFFPEISSLTSPTSTKTIGSYLSIDNLSVKVGTTNLAVPNADFENWSTIITDKANGWLSSETYMTKSLTKSTEKNTGLSSAKITTGTFVGSTQTGVLSLGTIQYGVTSADDIYLPSFKINNIPSSFNFHSKYTAGSNVLDSGEVVVFLTKRVGNKTKVVGGGNSIISPTNTFVANKTNVYLNLGETSADSAIIIFKSSRGLGSINRAVGSALWIDDVTFDYTPLGLSNEQMSDNVVLSPNPAHSFVNIQNNEAVDLTLNIKELSGKIIGSSNLVSNSLLNLDVSKYAKGIYILEMSSQNYKTIKKLVVE